MFLKLIRTKVIFAVVSCFALCIALSVEITKRSWNRDVERISQQALKTSREGFQNLEKNDIRTLSSTLEAMMHDPAYLEPYAKRDFDELFARCKPVYDGMKARYGITHWYFIDQDGICFMRVHKPEQKGDPVRRATFFASQKSGGFGTGLELGKTAFALRVVHPILNGGKMIGYLELGEEIDHFLELLKGQTGAEYGLIVMKKFLSEKDWASVRANAGLPNNWDDQRVNLLIGATTKEEGLVSYTEDIETLPEGGLFLGMVEKGGKVYCKGVIPVVDASNKNAGGLFVLQDVTETYSGIKKDHLMMALVLTGFMLILTILLVNLLNVFVFRRIEVAIDATLRFVGGDHETPIKKCADDEVGRLEELLEQLRVVFLDAIRTLSGKH